jgi:hypothetical protein
MGRHKRRKHFIDKEIQGMLIRQAAKYWLLSLGAVGPFRQQVGYSSLRDLVPS